MTKTYFPFDSGSGAAITENQWSKMAQFWLNSGVFSGYLNEMLVYADSSGMQVKVKTGGGWIQGHYYSNDTEEILAIQAAHASLPRIDRVVLYVDWVNNLCNTGVITGTPAAVPAAPALAQNTNIWQISLAQIYVAAAVATLAAGTVTDERPFAANSVPDGYQTNTSGVSLSAGMVVVRDTSVAGGFKTTVKSGDPSICGILIQAVGSNGKTRLVKKGYYNVATTGVVIPNHWLVTSTTAGYAQDSGSTQRPTTGGIGIAQAASAGGLALIPTDVDIVIYTGSSLLQRLPSITRYQAASALTVHSITVFVDSGADCIVVQLSNAGSNGPSSVTLDGVIAFTRVGTVTSNSASYHTDEIWQLKNPPNNVSHIVNVNFGSSIQPVVQITNWIGTQAVPFRAVVTNSGASQTASSITPTSQVGDWVIDVISETLAVGWEAGIAGGQTLDAYWDAFAATRSAQMSIKPGGNGTTTMAWSGASANIAHLAVALAGS